MESEKFFQGGPSLTIKEFFHRSRVWVFYVCVMAAFTLFGVTYSDIRASKRNQNITEELSGLQLQLQNMQDNTVNEKLVSERIESLELSIANLESSVNRMVGTIDAKEK